MLCGTNFGELSVLSYACLWIDTEVAHAGCNAIKAFDEVRISPFARREAEQGRLGEELEPHQLDHRHMAILQHNDFWCAGQLPAFLRNGGTWVCPSTSGREQVFGDDVSPSDASVHIAKPPPAFCRRHEDLQAAPAIPQSTRDLVFACHSAFDAMSFCIMITSHRTAPCSSCPGC